MLPTKPLLVVLDLTPLVGLMTKKMQKDGVGSMQLDENITTNMASLSIMPIMFSLFYAWRITGNQMWRDMAWDSFLHMKKYLATETSWASIVNVNDPSSALYDQTETFLFSEVFKYLYLIFDDSGSYSLNDYVFTTEGHLFKRSGVDTTSNQRTMNKRQQANGGSSSVWNAVQGGKL
jgi:hypothetical protein